MRKILCTLALALVASIGFAQESSTLDPLQIDGVRVKTQLAWADVTDRPIFQEITPCVLVDTRSTSKFDAPFAGPAFNTGDTRTYSFASNIFPATNPCTLANRQAVDSDAKDIPQGIIGAALGVYVYNQTSGVAGVMVAGDPDSQNRGQMSFFYGDAGPGAKQGHDGIVRTGAGQSFDLSILDGGQNTPDTTDVVVILLGYYQSDPNSVGAVGATGAQGDVGPMGATGSTGAKGDTGSQGLTGATGATGAKGDTGLTGSQGVQGVKGDTGAQGVKGDQGIKGNTGDVGPAGPTGPQGFIGPQGIPGATGPQGSIGATGPAGAKGDKGDTGALGPQGIQGVKGDTGSTGATGATGPKGDKGDQGFIGATGPQGIQGPSGPIGPAGVKGDTGPACTVVGNSAINPTAWAMSCNGVIVSRWQDGKDGLAGPAGPQGTPGATGATGSQGVAGPTGPIGPQGIKGDTGATGPAGTNGTNGTNGAPGIQGAPGINGANGAKGDKGDTGLTGPPGASSCPTLTCGQVLIEGVPCAGVGGSPTPEWACQSTTVTVPGLTSSCQVQLLGYIDADRLPKGETLVTPKVTSKGNGFFTVTGNHGLTVGYCTLCCSTSSSALDKLEEVGHGVVTP